MTRCDCEEGVEPLRSICHHLGVDGTAGYGVYFASPVHPYQGRWEGQEAMVARSPFIGAAIHAGEVADL